MRRLLCIAALALAPAPRAQQQPAVTCDEMKAQFYNLVARGGRHLPEGTNRNYEEAKKLLQVCGDHDDPFVRYVARWVEKYDAAGRGFEAGRDGGALGAAHGAWLTKGLTKAP